MWKTWFRDFRDYIISRFEHRYKYNTYKNWSFERSCERIEAFIKDDLQLNDLYYNDPECILGIYMLVHSNRAWTEYLIDS